MPQSSKQPCRRRWKFGEAGLQLEVVRLPKPGAAAAAASGQQPAGAAAPSTRRRSEQTDLLASVQACERGGGCHLPNRVCGAAAAGAVAHARRATAACMSQQAALQQRALTQRPVGQAPAVGGGAAILLLFAAGSSQRRTGEVSGPRGRAGQELRMSPAAPQRSAASWHRQRPRNAEICASPC